MLSFHFPQKGSSAAQSVPARKQASASEKQKPLMVLPPAVHYSQKFGQYKRQGAPSPHMVGDKSLPFTHLPGDEEFECKRPGKRQERQYWLYNYGPRSVTAVSDTSHSP